MRWNTDCQRVQTGARKKADGAVFPARQDERQRSGPEFFRQPIGAAIEMNQGPGCGRGGDVDDQRVECRPALGGEDRGDGLAVGGVAA